MRPTINFHPSFSRKISCNLSIASGVEKGFLFLGVDRLLGLKKYYLFSIVLMQLFSASAQSPAMFKSSPLEEKGDLSQMMVEGIDLFLGREGERVRKGRPDLWHRDFSSSEAFIRSISHQRDLLSNRLGVIEDRTDPFMEVLTDDLLQRFEMETASMTVRAVRWKVFEDTFKGLSAEGLYLRPKGKILARVVFIPDADMLPEVAAGFMGEGDAGYDVARKLVESGIEVLIPVLVSRDDTYSGSQLVGRFTNQPHREWIYRQGFVLGRHVIGYELQKVFAAIDWLSLQNREKEADLPIGVAGYGEGGMLALQAAALDARISSTLVSGYFDTREKVWQEPIYRNVFGLLECFGDAELAVMAWPRRLVVENSAFATISGRPIASEGRSGAAPGRIQTPDRLTAHAEWKRAEALVPPGKSNLLWHGTGNEAFSFVALNDFALGLNVQLSNALSSRPPSIEIADWPDPVARQERTVRDMEYQIQRTLSLSELTRNTQFWQTLPEPTADLEEIKKEHRNQLWEVIGRLPDPSIAANPEARFLKETEKWISYEVKLDVWPDVFTWGVLIIPKDIAPGEQRPAVVCQHGLEGTPMDVINTDKESAAYRPYQGFASVLADRGYVVFAPQNPYIGEDHFRVLQRKANPLGLSLFSVITGQHQRLVEWLGQQSFIDSSRIGFYGLSYGGKAAMRVPALVEGYALSICSGDFNEWIRKVASTDYDAYNSYPFTKEYEIPEWNLGHTYSYAEMAALIAPRSFMVERGHYDGTGTDEWVAYEFAKVRRHYDFLGLPEAIGIEYFNGGHTINGKGTFEFLDRHLRKR